MRTALVPLFLGLCGFAAWWQQPRPATESAPVEYTFEASRRGLGAIEAPGPFTQGDFLRLILRRSGTFHLDVTREYRLRRLADPVDLWETDVPGTLRVEVADDRLRVVRVPERLRLAVGVSYNLPVILRNRENHAVDVKLIGHWKEDRAADRFTAPPGLSFFSFNLRPRTTGSAPVELRLYAGTRMPEGGTPPESTVTQDLSFPADVVGWGTLRLRASPPARVYIVGSDELAYAPEGKLVRIAWSSGDYFYHHGSGEDVIRLPEGAASVEAIRGFEFTPIHRKVQIGPGETSLSLDLERQTDLAGEGWYSGDVHVHGNYTNHEFITPEDIRDQLEAEDLNVANLMVANSEGPHVHDEQYFEGRPHRLSTPKHILYWGEEMRNAGLYGHLCLSGLKSLVKPLYTGFANSPWQHDYPPNHVQGAAAIGQGGAASYAHPGYRFTDDPQTMSARELPVDLALGSVGAMDVLSNSDETAATGLWYRLLNTGLRCAISAGTDSMTNQRHAWLVGGQRVFVQVDGRFDFEAWLKGYKAGRSFATNGPIVRFSVAGKGPGQDVRLDRPGEVTIVAAASSILPFDALEVVADGEVVASQPPGQGGRAARVEARRRLEHSSWLAARVRGPYNRLLANDSFLYAHTGPVYCLIGDEKIGFRSDARFFVAWIDKLIGLVERRGRYASEDQKREVVALFQKGRAYYEGVAEHGR